MAKSVLVQFRATPGGREDLKGFAASEGMTLSEWLRMLAWRRADQLAERRALRERMAAEGLVEGTSVAEEPQPAGR
jgi:hypothetical protein